MEIIPVKLMGCPTDVIDDKGQGAPAHLPSSASVSRV